METFKVPDREQRMINGRSETIVSVALMRESDAYTIANLVPGAELMRRAAQGIYENVSWRGRIAVIAGGGNNGGDGFALAGILAANGIKAEVFRTSEKLTVDGAYYLERALEAGTIVRQFTEETGLSGYDIIVDCILGTGFSGEPRGLARSAIEAINAADAYVVSADINSGLNGDTGEGDIAVRSDLTVSIGYYKRGLFEGNAAAYIGAMVNVDIGIKLI